MIMMKMVMVGKIEMMWVNWATSPIKINPAITMIFILLMPLSRWIDETCLSSKEPPALADDFAKAMIVQLLNVLHSYSSIIFICVIIIYNPFSLTYTRAMDNMCPIQAVHVVWLRRVWLKVWLWQLKQHGDSRVCLILSSADKELTLVSIKFYLSPLCSTVEPSRVFCDSVQCALECDGPPVWGDSSWLGGPDYSSLFHLQPTNHQYLHHNERRWI